MSKNNGLPIFVRGLGFTLALARGELTISPKYQCVAGTCFWLRTAWHLLILLLDLCLCAPGLQVARYRNSERGVTIIEMMTVVAIIAIATALAVPNYKTWISRYQLKQATTELHSNLSVARMAAMNRNTSVTVQVTNGVVDPNDGRAKVTATFAAANGAQVIQPQRMPIAVTAFSGTPTIQFNSLGLRVGGGAGVQSITLTNQDGVAYQIQVTPAGKPRWCPTSPCP